MNSNMIELDVYGNPAIIPSTINFLTEAVKIYLNNKSNSISFIDVNEDNYHSYFTERVKSKKGIYSIYRVESPMISDIRYNYIGSSYSKLSGRASKFARAILGKNTAGDKDHRHYKTYIDKFGRNFDNTYITFFELPREFSFVSEADVRKIEGDIIRYYKGLYGGAVVNVIDKPTISTMTDRKKRMRQSGQMNPSALELYYEHE